MPGFTADPESINGSVNLLAEIAALLYEKRLHREIGMLCRAQPCHSDVTTKVEEIATFADDQYCDLVLLLIALATKLKETRQDYLFVDKLAQRSWTEFWRKVITSHRRAERSVMVTYRGDVKYIEEAGPGLIERNAAEFARVGAVLDSVEPTILRASQIEWESIAREKFDLRVKDAKSLIENLSVGFRKASDALFKYSDEVERAKGKVSAGLTASGELRRVLDAPGLRDLLAYLGTLPDMNYDDPMKQYEKVGAHFGVRFSFRGMPRFDDLADDAERLYKQADQAFLDAKAIEESAREDCLAKLGVARAALPEFATLPGRDFRDVHDIAARIEALQAELAQARAGKNVSLPGGGPREDTWPSDPDGDVTTKLEEIKRLAASHQQASNSYWGTVGIPWLESKWIENNKDLIADIAARSGIPPKMLAAILLKESDDFFLNDGKEQARAEGFAAGDRDETSFGPMEIQIRRAAEVLGYDPAGLTDAQRDEVRSALKDPVSSLCIAAEYMEQLKAGSDFANVPAAEMTDEHYRQLAQMYNGGPYWKSSDAKAYGDDFMEHSLPAARDALG